MVEACQSRRVRGLWPKQVKVLDYPGKVDNTWHMVLLKMTYHHWLLDTVIYYYPGNHGPICTPLSYQRATPVTTP